MGPVEESWFAPSAEHQHEENELHLQSKLQEEANYHLFGSRMDRRTKEQPGGSAAYGGAEGGSLCPLPPRVRAGGWGSHQRFSTQPSAAAKRGGMLKSVHQCVVWNSELIFPQKPTQAAVGSRPGPKEPDE